MGRKPIAVACNDCGHKFEATPGKGGLPYVYCPECNKRGVDKIPLKKKKPAKAKAKPRPKPKPKKAKKAREPKITFVHPLTGPIEELNQLLARLDDEPELEEQVKALRKKINNE